MVTAKKDKKSEKSKRNDEHTAIPTSVAASIKVVAGGWGWAG